MWFELALTVQNKAVAEYDVHGIMKDNTPDRQVSGNHEWLGVPMGQRPLWNWIYYWHFVWEH